MLGKGSLVPSSSDGIRTWLQLFVMTRFLHANRYPLRSKTLYDGINGERLRRAARLSEEADFARIRPQLRSDRGSDRGGAAARRPAGVVVGDAAQSRRED